MYKNCEMNRLQTSQLNLASHSEYKKRISPSLTQDEYYKKNNETGLLESDQYYDSINPLSLNQIYLGNQSFIGLSSDSFIFKDLDNVINSALKLLKEMPKKMSAQQKEKVKDFEKNFYLLKGKFKEFEINLTNSFNKKNNVSENIKYGAESLQQQKNLAFPNNSKTNLPEKNNILRLCFDEVNDSLSQLQTMNNHKILTEDTLFSKRKNEAAIFLFFFANFIFSLFYQINSDDSHIRKEDILSMCIRFNALFFFTLLTYSFTSCVYEKMNAPFREFNKKIEGLKNKIIQFQKHLFSDFQIKPKSFSNTPSEFLKQSASSFIHTY